MAMARYINAFEDQVEVLAGLEIGTLWDRMRGSFLNEYARLARSGMGADELERALLAFIDGLSESTEADLARQGAGVAYNEGRDAEILTARTDGRAMFVVRSEVLDSNTCDPCATLDGQVFEIGTAEYRAAKPPSMCEGRDRCRGFYVPVRG